ncbi:MAG: ferredoxin [Oscillospiraceae bacterium]|jgi:ferredoxin|nr:ferredoxin [Oscillospiraceae bacterium]
MIRKIIKIDEEKCNGCGLCVNACHEGAIGLVDGKAKLLRDDYCDGLGNCLPVCPTNAISFEEREAAAYDEEAVKAAQEAKNAHQPKTLACGCPGTHSKKLEPKAAPKMEIPSSGFSVPVSQLGQWPVQIKLVPVNAPYFENANLLVAADCTAFAFGDFHNRFIRNRITLIGCPKLDEGDYSEKLTEILKRNNIKSITVVRMEVPCCGGIVNAVTTALKNSGKMIPWQVVTISTDGEIIE